MQEKDLHRIWESLVCPVVLFTTDQQPIVIHHPGLPNRGSGPDFQQAVISIRDTRLMGRVEIHLRSSDWFCHAHHLDGSYRNVILHVVGEQDLPESSLALIPAPTVIFPVGFSSARRSVCSFIPVREMALRRLEYKEHSYRVLLRHAPALHWFHSSLYTSCGYPDQQQAFRQVFLHLNHLEQSGTVPLFHLQPPLGLILFLLLFGKSAMSRSAYNQILNILARTDFVREIGHLHFPPVPPIRFSRIRSRPAHHPLKRLESLYHFFSENEPSWLFHETTKLVNGCSHPARLLESLRKLFRFSPSFPIFLRPGSRYLFSTERLVEWLMSDGIPLFLASESKPSVREQLLHLYFSLPAGYRFAGPAFTLAWQHQAFRFHATRLSATLPG